MVNTRYSPKKKFGQHFLNDEEVLERIVLQADLKPNDIVWEVGAGLGALTEHLLRRDIDLTIFEIDNDLYPLLEKKYSDKCKVKHKDILKLDWETEINRKDIKIVTNLPYQISSPFLYKIFENYRFINNVVVMLQKEVAKRVCAKPNKKDYGVLSLKTQFLYKTEYLFEVPPEKFTPPPEVESSVIRLLPRKDIPYIEHSAYFWDIVEAAFKMKRKTLRNNLKPLLIKTGTNNSCFPVDLSRRGETLSEKEFIAVYEHILEHDNPC